MNYSRDISSLLKLLSDPTRLRILSILEGTELTVKELTEALQLGQSTLSTQLGQLKDSPLLAFRKENQFVYYRLAAFDDEGFVKDLCSRILEESRASEWYVRDQRRLQDIFEKRREASLAFFGALQAQNQTSPGQTWEALARGLLETLSPLKVIDLGCGLGRLAALFAGTGSQVTGIDNSSEQIQTARRLHKSYHEDQLKFLKAPMEETGLPEASFDLAILSHALHHAASPKACIREAYRLLRPKGKLLIMDLHKHSEEWLKTRFADFWMGFEPKDLSLWMEECGFSDVRTQIAGPDSDYPQIEPLVVLGHKT